MEKTEIKLSTKAKDELQEDESILWLGQPEPFPLMNAAGKKGLVTRWIICAAVFAVLAVVYTLITVNGPAGFQPAVIVVLAIVFGYLMLVPALDHNKVQKKCQYIVTDRRVLTAVGDNMVLALGRAGVKLSAVPAENGCVHLLFGAAEGLSAGKLLVKSFMPIKGKDGEAITGLIFYNVKDSEELRGILNY